MASAKATFEDVRRKIEAEIENSIGLAALDRAIQKALVDSTLVAQHREPGEQ